MCVLLLLWRRRWRRRSGRIHLGDAAGVLHRGRPHPALLLVKPDHLPARPYDVLRHVRRPLLYGMIPPRPPPCSEFLSQLFLLLQVWMGGRHAVGRLSLPVAELRYASIHSVRVSSQTHCVLFTQWSSCCCPSTILPSGPFFAHRFLLRGYTLSSGSYVQMLPVDCMLDHR